MHRLIYVLAAVVLAACASPQPVIIEEPANVEGTWVWVQSAGGKMGRQLTPKSEGYTLSMTFGANGRFVVRRAGEGWTTGRFTISTGAPDSTMSYELDRSPEGRTVMSWTGLGDPPRHTISLGGSRTLILDEGCCDRYRHEFRRDQ